VIGMTDYFPKGVQEDSDKVHQRMKAAIIDLDKRMQALEAEHFTIIRCPKCHAEIRLSKDLAGSSGHAFTRCSCGELIHLS